METFAVGNTLSWNTDPDRWQAIRPRPDKPTSSHVSAGIIGSMGLVWVIERGRSNVAEPWLSADDIAAHLGITEDTVYTWIAEWVRRDGASASTRDEDAE